MTTESSAIVIEMVDQIAREKYANERRLAMYRWRYNEVLEMHEPPLSFEREPDRWLSAKWLQADAAKTRKINYFHTLKRMQALYVMHIPVCCSATFVITKDGLYCIRTHLGSDQWVICPIYLFHQELTLIQMQILEQLKKLSLGDILPTIVTTEKETPTNKICVQKYKRGDESACRRFESILRLIPGDYKNGAWKPLDGFFGVYYNEETQELTEFFPEIVQS